MQNESPVDLFQLRTNDPRAGGKILVTPKGVAMSLDKAVKRLAVMTRQSTPHVEISFVPKGTFAGGKFFNEEVGFLILSGAALFFQLKPNDQEYYAQELAKSKDSNDEYSSRVRVSREFFCLPRNIPYLIFAKEDLLLLQSCEQSSEQLRACSWRPFVALAEHGLELVQGFMRLITLEDEQAETGEKLTAQEQISVLEKRTTAHNYYWNRIHAYLQIGYRQNPDSLE